MYLILSPSDIFYLTGVTIHEVGEVMILTMNNEQGRMKNEKGIIFCDPRTSGLFNAERFQIIDDKEMWKEKMGQYPILTTDPDYLTQSLRQQLEKYGVEFNFSPSPVTIKRVIKNDGEISLLIESQRINKEVFERIQSFLQIGVSELSIVRKILILQLELGSDGPSFPPIVAFGENTSVPHHSPTERILQRDDMVLIDMGVVYRGYCSDMTRCFFPEDMEYGNTK